ncbi:MAG: A24 family peptidase C-terminal domain-containing protein [Candidatus Hydrothermarchaeota archaeon]
MIVYLCLLISFSGALYAGYSDLKRGIIPNKLTFPMIATGIIIHALHGAYISDLRVVISGILGALVSFVFGYVLWLLGAWSGGDVKLLTGFGALLPYGIPKVSDYPALSPFPLVGFAPYPFFLTIFLNSVIGIAPFLLFYVFYVGRDKKDELKKIFEPFLKPWGIFETSFVLMGFGYAGILISALLRLRFAFIIVLPMLFLAYRLEIRIRRLLTLLFLVLMLISYSYVSKVLVIWLYIFFMILIVQFIITFASVTRTKILVDRKRISELKEGEISGETIYFKEGKVIRERGYGIKEIVDMILKGDFDMLKSRDVIVSSKSAAGVTQEQIETLNKLVKDGKLEDEIIVKKGMPYGPALFLGLFISMIFGDLFWAVLI